MNIFLDTEPEKQPQGTYRYGVNLVSDSTTGSMGSLVNEPGNTKAVDLSGILKGSITLDRYRHVLFIGDNEISVFNSKDFTLEVKAIADFNFGSIITGEHSILGGCEEIIYWRDSINSDRQFNLDRPELYQIDGEFDINLFNINPDTGQPIIQTSIIENGGQLELGRYFFAVQLLDQNENVIQSSQVSFGVDIVDDVDGGLNLSTNLPQIGGVPKTSKAIRVDVSNLSDFPFIKIIVFRGITADGVTTDTHVIDQLIPVQNGVASFVYAGFNPNQDSFIDSKEIIVPKAIYQSSRVMEQIDNKLLRANLVESIRGYSNYQAAASLICTNYVTQDVDKDTKVVITELGGEVKDYAICFIHEDGIISPPFHIPGSNMLTSDEVPVSVDFETSEESDILVRLTGTHEFSGNNSKYTIAHLFNTSGVISASLRLPDGSLQTISNGSGTFDYYTRKATSFPPKLNIVIEAKKGDGNYFIEQEFIFPFQGVYRLVSRTINTTLPKWKVANTASSGRLGYYQSDEVYTNPPNYCGDDYWGKDCSGKSLLGKPVRYHVIPDRSVEPLVVDQKLRKIGVSFSNITYPSTDIVGHFFVTNIRDSLNSLVVGKGLMIPYMHRNMDNIVYRYDEGRYIHNVAGDQITPSILQNIVTNEFLFNKGSVTGDYITYEGKYNEKKYERDRNINEYFDNSLPYRDLSLYGKFHELETFESVTPKIYGVNKSYVLPKRSEYNNVINNSHSSNFNILVLKQPTDTTPFKYVAVKRLADAFPSVWNIRYRRLGDIGENTIFNGDAYISKTDITNISWVSASKPFLAQNSIKFEFELIKNLYTESTINSNYRHEGTDLCNKYWTQDKPIFDFITDKVTESQDNKPIARASICEEFYGYNKDYSLQNTFNTYIPLSFTYNYCSDCLGLYPNRIIFSQPSFAEDQADQRRLYLANDYVDIPADKGQIISMNYYNGKLIVRTEYASYFLQPNPQQIQLSESTAYIGTGDFLSIPAGELNVIPTGYGGQQYELAEVVTKHGLVWCDSLSGDIIHISDGVDELSRNGLYHWFRKNLKGEVIMTYDPEFERLLLTNQNKYTISYDFKTKGWKSWHSYVPYRYLYDGDSFLSIEDKSIWKHQSNRFSNYYGVDYSSEVEFVILDDKAFNAQSVQYYSKAQLFDLENQNWVDVHNITFDKGWLFNSNQSTGFFNINYSDSPYDSIRFSNTNKLVKLTDKKYKLSGLYDIAVNNNILRTINEYTVEPTNVDYELQQYKLSSFRDKFARIRLVFSKNEYKHIINMLDTLKYYYER